MLDHNFNALGPWQEAHGGPSVWQSKHAHSLTRSEKKTGRESLGPCNPWGHAFDESLPVHPALNQVPPPL